LRSDKGAADIDNGNGAWGVKPFGFVFGRDETC